MNFLFPYMARWRALNWSRYQQIFTQLAELGHNVHIIQSPAQNSNETNFQEISIDLPPTLYLHEVEVNPLIWNHRFPLNKLVKKGYYSLKTISKVKEFVKKFDIDVLFIYNIPQYPLLKVNSCLKIFDMGDDYMAMLGQELGKFSNALILKIGEFILNRIIQQSDIVLSISQVLLDSIKLKDKLHILPNGVNLNGITQGCGLTIRDRYKKPIIGFIGSFEYFIDFELILNAAQRLSNYTFLLVGTGRQYDDVKNKIKDRNLNNVILTGGVPHSEVIKYIDAMDICLNIFKKIRISHSACPIKLFEYLSMKKPVISTRLEEIEKYIDDGFLFYADSVVELERAINTILENNELVVKCTENGFNLVKAKYQWSHIVNDFLGIVASKKHF
jgi:glycosyltransferase involved in cell wall biosynthesis